MSYKFKFIPKHMGEELTVYYFIDSQDFDDYEWELEYISDSSGNDVNLEDLHPEDGILLENELEQHVANNAYEAFLNKRIAMAEDAYDRFKEEV